MGGIQALEQNATQNRLVGPLGGPTGSPFLTTAHHHCHTFNAGVQMHGNPQRPAEVLDQSASSGASPTPGSVLSGVSDIHLLDD